MKSMIARSICNSLICVFLFSTALACSGGGSAAAGADLKDIIPGAVLEFIETGKGAAVHPGFLKYAYGNIAEGLYHLTLKDPGLTERLSPLIGKLAAAYIRLAPRDTDGLRRPGSHGNYLANLNLILGAYKKITGRDDYAGLNRRITLHLADGSRAAAQHHFPSYPGTTLRWPADQSLILYSIRLHDENYSTGYAGPLFAEWKDFLAAGFTDKKTGLPVSEISGKTAYSRLPRGCATSYLILYTAKLDREAAGRWFGNYKKHFLKDYVFAAGFKETADGNFKADADSGPIIDGVGAAATAFGIGAAYALGDDGLAARLESLIAMGRSYSQNLDEKTRAAAIDIVAQAIEFNMKSQKYRRQANARL